jgi:transposase
MRNWLRTRQTGELERLREENAKLTARVAELEALVAKLETLVAELKARLEQNSRNSSMPPSSDPPSTPVLPKKPGSGRKPGGQPGHPGHQRELVPAGQVDKMIPVKPKNCRGCHALLIGHDADPQRHQITEIPQIKPHITEYQLHTLTCEKCNMATTAVLPKGICQGAFGPKTIAIVSLLTGFYHLGRRQAMQAMRDLFGIRMCLGSVISCEQITSRALKTPVLEAQAYVKEQNVKHADETSWYEGISRKRVWLWVALTEKVTVILIRASARTVRREAGSSNGS